MARNSWGKIRKLPSGRFQASYLDPATKKRVNAPQTFQTKTQAKAWLSQAESEKILTLLVPEASKRSERLDVGQQTTLRDYASNWRSKARSSAGVGLKPRTMSEYARYIENALAPIADLPLASITPERVEQCFYDLEAKGPNYASKVYSHLRSLMSEAHRRGHIVENPCQLGKAARYQKAEEELTPTREQVAVMLESAPDRWKALIEVASWGCLRRGEALELRRKDLTRGKKDDADVFTVSVHRSVSKGEVTEPKTKGSKRDVQLPPRSTPILDQHLASMPDNPEALLFPNWLNGHTNWSVHIPEATFQKQWDEIRQSANYPGTFHSLRSFGLTVFGETGATLAQIMRRGGHSNVQTAMRYQRDIGTDSDLVMLLR